MLYKETIVDCGQNIELLGALAKLRKVTITFVMSIRPSVRPSAWSNSVSTQGIFMKFDI